MKFEQQEMCVDEVEISIKNIIAQCINKLGVIVVSTLVFAIMLPVLFYYIELTEYNNQMQDSDVVEELTDDDLLIIDKYLFAKDRMEFLDEYKEKSLILEMDYNNVYQGKLQFHVAAKDEIKDDIANAIQNYINNACFAEALSKKVESVDVKYAYELVTAKVSEYPSAIVNVYVYATNAEECNDIAAVIKEEVNNYSLSLKTVIGDNVVAVIGENYCCGYVDDVYRMQSNYIQYVQTALSEIDTYEATLTPIQKNAIPEMEEDDLVNSSKDEMVKPTFSVVLLLLGVCVGLVFGVAIVILLTIFNGKLQSEKELAKRLNIEYLGNVRIGKKNKVNGLVDKYVYKIKCDEKEIDSLCARIKYSLKDSTTKKINIISTCEDFNNIMSNELENNLKLQGIECEIIGNIVDDVEAFKAIEGKDNIILVEVIGKSSVKEIYEEATICLNTNAPVIGYISIRA